MSDNKETKRFRLWHALVAAAAVLIISFCTFTAVRAISFKNTKIPRLLSAQDSVDLGNLLISQYPEKYEYLKPIIIN